MRSFFFALGMVLAGAAMSQDKAMSQDNITDEDFCKGVSRAAGATMRSRQAGVPLADQMERAAKFSSPRIKEMVLSAYEVPSFQTQEMREKAAIEFSNRAYLDCYKSVKNSK